MSYTDTDLNELTPDIVDATELVGTIEAQLEADDEYIVEATLAGHADVVQDIRNEEADLEALEDSILDAAAGIPSDAQWASTEADNDIDWC